MVRNRPKHHGVGRKHKRHAGKIKNKFKSNKVKVHKLYENTKTKNSKLKNVRTQSDRIFMKKKENVNVEIVASSDSEVEVDHMDQLLSTFKDDLINKNSLSIESGSDSSNEYDNEYMDTSHSEDETETLNEAKRLSDKDEKEGNIVNKLNSYGSDAYEEELYNEIDTETEEEIESCYDPFVKHLFYDLHDNLLSNLQVTPMCSNEHIYVWPNVKKIIIEIPKYDFQDDSNNRFSINEKKLYASQGEFPEEPNEKKFSLKNMHVKSQIIENLNKTNRSSNIYSIFSPLQIEIFALINNYQDFYYPRRTFNNAEEIRFVYCVHIANHILKTRIKVIHHNAKLSKKDEVSEEFRDQGLVRPKVLVLVPFKDAAYKIIKLVIDIILKEDKGNVINKKKFIDEYSANEIAFPKKNPKPEDYEQTFQGNTDDNFKIGITVTKKSLKLYSDFYSSDIILGSPLGLRTVIGAEGEQDRDYDFLSSIELLILDQTEIFLMQNWDHVIHILNHMHLQPKMAHGTDFSRVRTWSLNGWAKYYRQTLLFSSIALPEINAVFNKKCWNYAGKIRSMYTVEFGSINHVCVQVPHVFHKFSVKNAQESIDARFEYFKTKILPQQKESLMRQSLIFIPNYFDYVRVRNLFKKEDIGFVQICEYSKESKIARARDIFFHGDAQFMLYTERFHFFNRKKIKGIRHLVFYQLPNMPHFYHEMCNLMQEANMNRKVGTTSNMTVTVIYSKYDIHQLSAVLGTERASKMCQSDKKIHMVVTEAD